MGMSLRARVETRLRHRLDDWQWRVRYWWLDTDEGKRAHVAVFCVSVLVLIYQLLVMAVAALYPPPAHEPKAAAWWIVQIIIAVVAAVISYAMRPKPPKQAEPKHQGPLVEEGGAVNQYFGTVRIKAQYVLAWKVTGKKKIKQKAGKK